MTIQLIRRIEANRTDVASETETDSDQSAILRSDEIEDTDNSVDNNLHQPSSDYDAAQEVLSDPSDIIEEDSASNDAVIPVAALDDKEENTQEISFRIYIGRSRIHTF